MTEVIIISVQVSIVAYVYCELLIKEGHILHPFYKWLDSKLTKTVEEKVTADVPDEVKAIGFKPMLTKFTTKKSPLLKVLGGCVFCTAGQWTLWAYVAWSISKHLPEWFVKWIYQLWLLVFAISLSIFIVIVVRKLIEKWS